MKKHIWILGVVVIIAVVFGLVLSSTNNVIETVDGLVAGEVTVGTAIVDEVEVVMLESFPLQAVATIRGNLPDGCTLISENYDQILEGNILRVTLNTERPVDAMCTQALVPYVEDITLDILGLPAGDYVVDVNGTTALLTLDMDNMVDFESDKGLSN